jgi:type IV pilus assembly protein PilW
MTAKVHLLSRSTEASPGYTDTKTYPLGLQADDTQLVVGPFNDGFKRHAYTRTIRMNNPAGRRET